jgi:hypothetical protein
MHYSTKSVHTNQLRRDFFMSKNKKKKNKSKEELNDMKGKERYPKNRQ